MKSIYILLVLSNFGYGQIYGYPQPNQGPDDGIGNTFSSIGWAGAAYVRSEITVSGQTYSFIRDGEDNFKLSRKQGNQFKDIVKKLMVRNDEGTMGEDSRLLHVHEDQEVLNIYSWGRSGYNFLFYQKLPNQEPQLMRFGCIRNMVHTMEGFDKSIKAIKFEGATQMEITKEPETVASRRLRPYAFLADGVYEFRPDGVYLNGVFDPSVGDFESQFAIDENLRKDPLWYQKKQASHAARVASWQKGPMDADAAEIAANATQPTIKSPPADSKSTEIATRFAKPKAVANVPQPEALKNLTFWIGGLMGVLVIVLGYLGFHRLNKKVT